MDQSSSISLPDLFSQCEENSYKEIEILGEPVFDVYDDEHVFCVNDEEVSVTSYGDLLLRMDKEQPCPFSQREENLYSEIDKYGEPVFDVYEDERGFPVKDGEISVRSYEDARHSTIILSRIGQPIFHHLSFATLCAETPEYTQNHLTFRKWSSHGTPISMFKIRGRIFSSTKECDAYLVNNGKRRNLTQINMTKQFYLSFPDYNKEEEEEKRSYVLGCCEAC